MKKTILSLVTSVILLSSFSSSALANGVFGIELPNLNIPGVRIPPISEWRVGGTLGTTWKGNAEALRYGAIGSVLLGPIGLIYGIHMGAKFDIQKRHAKNLYDRMVEQQTQIKVGAERFPSEAADIANSYNTVGEYLAGKGAPEVAFDQLGDLSLDAAICLFRAAEANSQDQAYDCSDSFLANATALKRQYR
ncbi:MAG: hypothetical protein EOP48_16235 [Sphingobacteriales bacterium]|nr:MAG: hypothetical protein EOP48_16235 [Sphingobacteriales bacterium]